MYAVVNRDNFGKTTIHLCNHRPEYVDLSSSLQAELDAYFSGKLQRFTVEIKMSGTPFQQSVYAATAAIPYGETRSYGWVAKKIGKPGAARAVGQALNKNPLPIYIPCHRVVGQDGALVGFGGGIDNKMRLLKHEKEHVL